MNENHFCAACCKTIAFLFLYRDSFFIGRIVFSVVLCSIGHMLVGESLRSIKYASSKIVLSLKFSSDLFLEI